MFKREIDIKPFGNHYIHPVYDGRTEATEQPKCLVIYLSKPDSKEAFGIDIPISDELKAWMEK